MQIMLHATAVCSVRQRMIFSARLDCVYIIMLMINSCMCVCAEAHRARCEFISKCGVNKSRQAASIWHEFNGFYDYLTC